MGEKRPVRELAHAKLNLFLRVLSRRPDGYHDIETLIQPVTLADELRVDLELTDLAYGVTGPHAAGVPEDGSDLVDAAFDALYERGDPRITGARIELVKNVPVAAGLGGGSADAAATLRALDRLWMLSLGIEGLLPMAAELGSDVPALLWGGPVLAEGKGDRVEPVDVPDSWWVLIVQDFGVSSADAYGWWDRDGGPTGSGPAALLEALRGGDPDEYGPLLFNDLEGPVSARHTRVTGAREALLDAGALGAVMSGSGPTVAGLARDRGHAEELAGRTGGIAVASVGRRGTGPAPARPEG